MDPPPSTERPKQPRRSGDVGNEDPNEAAHETKKPNIDFKGQGSVSHILGFQECLVRAFVWLCKSLLGTQASPRIVQRRARSAAHLTLEREFPEMCQAKPRLLQLYNIPSCYSYLGSPCFTEDK